MKFEVEIDKIVPSPTIFPYDMTYSYSDSIREYDGLALATIKMVTKDGEDGITWKTVFFIEDLSGDETSKKIVDLALGNPEIVFLSDESAEKYMDMLAHIIISSKNISEEFRNYREEIFVNKYLTLWDYTYELHNLAFHTLLLAKSFRKKIEEDFRTLLETLNDNNGFPREIVEDVIDILAYANNERTYPKIKHIKGLKIKPRKAGAILGEYMKKLNSGKTLILVFPQMLRKEATNRIRKQKDAVKELVKYISKELKYITIETVGFGASIEQAKNIADKLKHLNMNSNVIAARNYRELLDKLTEEIKNFENIIVIILQDYFKPIIDELINILNKKKTLIILISEMTYSIRKQRARKERLIEAQILWGNMDLDNISYSKVLVLFFT